MATHGTEPVDTALFRQTRPRRAFDDVIFQIRGLVDSSQLNIGDRLPPERVLAAQFGVSRNTVREALRTLEISGLLTLRRGAQGGAYIIGNNTDTLATRFNTQLSLTDFSLGDLTDAMRWLCELVVRVSGPRLTEADYAVLEANLAQGANLSGQDDREERALVLTEFYNILARSSDNPILQLLVETLTGVMRGVIPHLATPDHAFVIRGRRKLLALLREGDVDGAVQELDRYLVRLHLRWLKSSNP